MSYSDVLADILLTKPIKRTLSKAILSLSDSIDSR